MFDHFKRTLFAGLLVAGSLLTPAVLRADDDKGHYGSDGYHPTNDGGALGLGLEFGDPGNWGITGKFWVDRVNAFQPAVKFNSPGSVILQFDYLWHNFDIIHMAGEGSMPLYIGLGGNLLLDSPLAVAGRVPVGISYIFDKRNVPVDIYLQAVPTLWFFNPSFTRFDIYGELGAHFYF